MHPAVPLNEGQPNKTKIPFSNSMLKHWEQQTNALLFLGHLQMMIIPYEITNKDRILQALFRNLLFKAYPHFNHLPFAIKKEKQGNKEGRNLTRSNLP